MLVARAAHELWRERMLNDGWRANSQFDEQLRTHDALVPFDDLPEEMQRDAEFEAIASGALDLLVRQEFHPRGEDSPLLPSTVRSGQKVKFVSGPSVEGIVIGCGINPELGWPEFVHVRWDDGAETSHPLAAGELRSVSPRDPDS